VTTSRPPTSVSDLSEHRFVNPALADARERNLSVATLLAESDLMEFPGDESEEQDLRAGTRLIEAMLVQLPTPTFVTEPSNDPEARRYGTVSVMRGASALRGLAAIVRDDTLMPDDSMFEMLAGKRYSELDIWLRRRVTNANVRLLEFQKILLAPEDRRRLADLASFTELTREDY
jgi:hypothetical protein